MDEPILKFPLSDGNELEVTYVAFKQIRWSFPKDANTKAHFMGIDYEVTMDSKEFMAYLKSSPLWEDISQDFFIREAP